MCLNLIESAVNMIFPVVENKQWGVGWVIPTLLLLLLIEK